MGVERFGDPPVSYRSRRRWVYGFFLVARWGMDCLYPHQERKNRIGESSRCYRSESDCLQDAAPRTQGATFWSPHGSWILYPSLTGLSLISSDGKSGRTVPPTAREFITYGLSKSGEQVIGILEDTALDRTEWELISVDIKTGVEKRLAALNLPPTVSGVEGFSLHPDGKRFATSIACFPYDIWMLEGFDQPKSMLERR